MNMSNFLYYTIGISVYLINLLIVVILRIFYSSNEERNGNQTTSLESQQTFRGFYLLSSSISSIS